MCQILQKPADYSLPMNLLSSTCTVNADGFGLMTVKDGELLLVKYYNGDNDPEEINEALKSVYDIDCFLHFRFKTKGPVSTEACHPFLIYDDNDRELALMHNGTLNGWGGADKVDSQDFGERFVAPLYDKFLRAGTREPLSDPFFKQIVTGFTGSSSKIVLLDNIGKPLIINEAGGEIYTDDAAGKSFWVSNKYSFNQSHRKTTTSNWGVHRGSTYSDTDFWKDYDEKYGTINGVFATGGGTNDDTWKTEGEKKAAEERLAAANKKLADDREAEAKKKEPTELPQRVQRKTYWGDVLKLDNIDDILDMQFEDVSDLVDIEPENAKLLINDLIWELYNTTYDLPENKKPDVAKEVVTN